MMTRQHLEMIAATLADTHAPPSLVYAMADRLALASAAGTAVTPTFDRSRFIAAATTDADVVTVTYTLGNAATVDEDGDFYPPDLVNDLNRAMGYGIDRGDERPILDANGNRCGRVERSTGGDR